MVFYFFNCPKKSNFAKEPNNHILMSKNNLFDGDSYKAIFAGITYKLLIGREWIKYADVMAKFNGMSSVKELKHNVSDYDYYGELKKAFPAVCDAPFQITADEIKTDRECLEVYFFNDGSGFQNVLQNESRRKRDVDGRVGEARRIS